MKGLNAQRTWLLRGDGDGVALGYFLVARFALAAAGLLLLVAPPDAGLGFYQPRTIALTHLLTLGWISASIFGVLSGPAPRFFGGRRTETSARPARPGGRVALALSLGDRFALALFTIGLAVFVSTFSLPVLFLRPTAATLVALAGSWPILRCLVWLRRARLPRASRGVIALACFGWFATALSGSVLSGLRALGGWPPFDPILRVAGHAHLGALSFAFTFVVGFAAQLLPMLLPAARPAAIWVWTTGGLVWTSGLVLAVVFWGGAGASAVWLLYAGGALAFLGIAAFFGQILWMLLHRRKPGPGRPRREASRWIVGGGFLALGVAVVLAASLLTSPEGNPRWISVYGITLLGGVLGALVQGFGAFVLPAWAWLCASGGRIPPEGLPTPWRLEPVRLRVLAAVSWAIGVIALAAHFGLGSGARIAGAAWLLAAICEFMILRRVQSRLTVAWATHASPGTG